jgi:hypothetical protein
MADETEHPLKLAVDIDDWLHARKLLSRALAGFGRCVPPPDAGRAAELARLIVAADRELARERIVWEVHIRPRLTKYEGAPVPPLIAL